MWAFGTVQVWIRMVGERWLKRCIGRLLCSPLLRRRVLLGGLFLLTLLVIVARLEAEADLAILDANTLVLQGGFPALAVNGSLLHIQQQQRQLQQQPQLKQQQPVELYHLQATEPSIPRGDFQLPHLHPPRILSAATSPLHPVPDLKMAALAAAQKRKWFGGHHFRPRLARGKKTPACSRLIAGDELERGRAKAFMEQHERVEKTPLAYMQETQNCSRFIHERGYIMSATEEEMTFPLAFSILMYTSPEQAERLLRAIYRPHNYYCIHVDQKSSPDIVAAMRAVAGCLPNVFIASKLNKVYWATWSSLEALIFCMEDLWKMSATWRYYINLTGQEFPLKTNLQLVRILRALNGSNVVDASTDPSRTSRWYNNFAPPHGIVPYKGMVFIVACRGFVDYVLHSPVARDFLQWVRYTDMPDETYFPSLNHNPHLKVPGSYKGPPDTNALTKPYLARFVNWNTNWKDGDGRYNFRFPCYGKRVRNICIFGVGDLPSLTSRKELFTNKLYAHYEPLTFNCMEEWLLNMTVADYAGQIVLNTTYYSTLDVVRNKML